MPAIPSRKPKAKKNKVKAKPPVPAARHEQVTSAARNFLLLMDTMEQQGAIRLPFVGYHKTKRALAEVLQ